jgi:putative transposase
VVFCPKYRRPVLVDGVDKRLQQIVSEVAAEIPFEVESLSIHVDHIHLLLNCSPQLSIHQIVKRIKSRSSSYLRQEFPWLKSRLPTLWSNSYFVATVGGAPLDVIKRYIEDQKWKTGG